MKRGPYKRPKLSTQKIQMINEELANDTPLRTILARKHIGYEQLKKEFNYAKVPCL